MVAASRGKLQLTKLLRGFPRVKDFRQLRAPEEPGDLGETDTAGERWDERRRLAIAGPTPDDSKCLTVTPSCGSWVLWAVFVAL